MKRVVPSVIEMVGMVESMARVVEVMGVVEAMVGKVEAMTSEVEAMACVVEVIVAAGLGGVAGSMLHVEECRSIAFLGVFEVVELMRFNSGKVLRERKALSAHVQTTNTNKGRGRQ
jgi:hypothetical protein